VLRAPECAELIALYGERERFRSRVVIERHRYGVGEYKYFARPMPPLVEELRVAMYRELAATANRWAERMRARDSYPASLEEFLEVCAAHGQTRPTPLILRYEQGGYNCLHQDLYGDVAFPLQFTCVLSQRGRDFEGGELLLVEQRPRAQSRGEAIALDAGERIIFANRYRPGPRRKRIPSREPASRRQHDQIRRALRDGRHLPRCRVNPAYGVWSSAGHLPSVQSQVAPSLSVRYLPQKSVQAVRLSSEP